MSHLYKIYCSTCNKETKKKMTWYKYIKYISFDRKSKGYHEIYPEYIVNKDEKTGGPSSCPFGHKINTNKTIIIPVDNNL